MRIGIGCWRSSHSWTHWWPSGVRGVSTRLSPVCSGSGDQVHRTGSGAALSRLSVTRVVRCDLTRADFTKAALPGVHLDGSTLADVQGGEALRGVVITSDQVVPLALAIFSSLGIRIDDEDSGVGEGRAG